MTINTPCIGDKFKYKSPYSGLSKWTDEVERVMSSSRLDKKTNKLESTYYILSKCGVMYNIDEIEIL